MAKFHYWTNASQDDDLETSISTLDPLITLAPAARRIDDTVLKVIFWASLGVTVGTTSLPDVGWLASCTVDYLLWFDNESSGVAVNIRDDVINTMGFTRLEQRMWLTPTTNKYNVLFQTPPTGITVRGRHKGYSASSPPSVSFQRWVGDNFGVFDNFASYGVKFSSRMQARILWASDEGP